MSTPNLHRSTARSKPHRTRDRLAKTAAALDLARTSLNKALDGANDEFVADAIRVALADVDSVRRRIANTLEWTRPAARR